MDRRVPDAILRGRWCGTQAGCFQKSCRPGKLNGLNGKIVPDWGEWTTVSVNLSNRSVRRVAGRVGRHSNPAFTIRIRNCWAIL